jgi:protein required for attachment to host cells
MLKSKINGGDWVVVCDGRKAVILQNAGDRQFPNLRMVETREQSDPPTHDQGTDRPGRVHPSVGTARSSVQQTNWHDDAEKAFLNGLASHLDSALQAGRTKHLFVVAPPRALGMLREAYTSRIRGALQGEFDKDLVHVPIYDIEKRLFS